MSQVGCSQSQSSVVWAAYLKRSIVLFCFVFCGSRLWNVLTSAGKNQKNMLLLYRLWTVMYPE